ncbi:hypothetical protein [Streptomyces sp. NPDC001508]|uniref:phage distal tail protein n=1 Tax=Streptomyces sp. NPDC001508 TaxID=3154656 RepID=UPI00332FFD70
MPYTPGAVLDGLGASLGALRLGAVDDTGVAWIFQTLDGWDSPDIRSEFSEREGDHGAWASPVYLGARPLTLAGTIVAPSRDLLDQAMERLQAAAGLGDTVLTVWESRPKQAVVRRSGKLLIQYVTDTTATYSVMVTAADPRRYSTTLQTGSTLLPSTSGGLAPPLTPPLTSTAETVQGQITAFNEGTFETKPVLIVDGPVVAPQILVQMPDASVVFLNYSETLGEGEQLVIDTDAHSVILNGNASRRRFLTLPTGWPTIPAGAVVTFQFRSSSMNSTAQLTIRWRSAWL